MQAELGERRVEASAGGGMVTAVVNGRRADLAADRSPGRGSG